MNMSLASATQQTLQKESITATLLRSKLAEFLYKIPDPALALAGALLQSSDETKSFFGAAGLISMVILEEII